MVENDWRHLTPDGEHDLMLLSNAEALAFARQLPEVKALVEAARKTHNRLEKDYRAEAEHRSLLSGMGVSDWPAYMPSEWHWLNDALVPFEEADDA